MPVCLFRPNWIVTIANMPNFLLMFDWLEKKQKMYVAQNILDKFLHMKGQNQSNDSSVHNLLLRMCNILADSIDALSISGKLIAIVFLFLFKYQCVTILQMKQEN